MSGLIKRLFAISLFGGLLLTVIFMNRRAVDSQNLWGEVNAEEALGRYGFYLREVSKEVGIDFVHQAPTLDAKLDNIMPLIASTGASVSIVDFDRDGWPDIYVVNSGEGSKNRLYRNQRDGTFVDVAEALGVADLNKPGTGVCTGAIWGDFDNDGYEDLLVFKWGRPELFHNDGGKGFTRVTEKAGLPDWINANSAVWLDFDNDGHLDLFIASYWPENLDLWHLESTEIMPESFEYAKNGGRKYLLRNRGDGTFEDVTEKMGIASTRWTLGVAAGNLCNSGYPDLFLANEYGLSELYANQGGKGFVEIGWSSGIGRTPKSGMNASFGDIYNKGQLSVYVTNVSEPEYLLQGNNMWVPQEGCSGLGMRYVNQASALGVETAGWSWGAQFGDLNNDGRLDLFLVNGNISADRQRSYWYDYSKIAGANRSIISDAKNWPAFKGRSLSGYQQKCVWVNQQDTFTNVAVPIGVADTFDGRSVALVDLWNRGVLDVVIANQKGPLIIYKNTVVPENNWIQFELEGTKSNRSAIGARVRLIWNGQEQVQEVSGGNGHASQNQRRLHFGLGKIEQIDKVVFEWPSGQTQTLISPRMNRLHKVKELP
jgi:enediyne biosynthesis protein E4